MKTTFASRLRSIAPTWRATAILTALCLAAVASQAGFEIRWSTIDGGGGTSTSSDGRFSVIGTAGQPDAGTLASSDGQFRLMGGFWQPADECACRLQIRFAAGLLTISWPEGLGGCVLEAASELRNPPETTIWTPVSPPPAGHSYVTPADSPYRFFRLRRA